MTVLNYLLTYLSEECMETGKEATKGIRFGLHDTFEDNAAPFNTIVEEFHDICGIMELLYDGGYLKRPSDEESKAMIDKKIEKAKLWAEYSAVKNQLSEPISD